MSFCIVFVLKTIRYYFFNISHIFDQSMSQFDQNKNTVTKYRTKIEIFI